jgi:hypothetical protein
MVTLLRPVKSATTITVQTRAAWSTPALQHEFIVRRIQNMELKGARFLDLSGSMGDLEIHHPFTQITHGCLTISGMATWVLDSASLLNVATIDHYYRITQLKPTLTAGVVAIDLNEFLQLDNQRLSVCESAFVTDGILAEGSIPLTKYLGRHRSHRKLYSQHYGKTTRTLTDRIKFFGRMTEYSGFSPTATPTRDEAEQLAYLALRSGDNIPEWGCWIELLDILDG